MRALQSMVAICTERLVLVFQALCNVLTASPGMAARCLKLPTFAAIVRAFQLVSDSYEGDKVALTALAVLSTLMAYAPSVEALAKVREGEVHYRKEEKLSVSLSQV